MKGLNWSDNSYTSTNFQDICYYSAPKKQLSLNSLEEADTELLSNHEGDNNKDKASDSEYDSELDSDLDFQFDNGASCLPIPPEEEKRIVSKLINLKEGNLYYVISIRWFSRRQMYVEHCAEIILCIWDYFNLSKHSLLKAPYHTLEDANMKIDWLAKVQFLGFVNLPNLVKLLGYCSVDGEKGIQRLLVYEFMPNRSLEDHPFSRTLPTFPGKMRLQIMLGAAHGLQYLHEGLEIQVIYKEFKSSNMLLDKKLYPKLSDFGLAREGPIGDQTHVSTACM
ncbi:serine/threonine-protein kinase PCRK1-like [Vicia villosa]|uniref:serine/threonine-protein kinase PCRK1-like n=1 Tax=Vicia villosa TaxID=3911 RepID=UPI00273CBBE6|nr:serine/threonine-protein kinase PCRK1-like [Vicia villosa]